MEEMRLMRAILAVYALGAPAATGYTLYALRRIRSADDPEMRARAAGFDEVKDATGLLESGLAVLAGILWPLVFVQYCRNRARR